MDSSDRKLLNDVKEFGWHVVLVEADEIGPAFGFSVGLFQTYQHSEVILFGLEVNVIGGVINLIGDKVKAGMKFEPQERYPDLVDSFDCTFREVPHRWYKEYLGCACWFYKTKTQFPVLQCFWPDKHSKFPWEPDFNPQWKGKQPLLFQY